MADLLAQADAIREAAAAQVERLRSRKELSPEAKRSAIAKIHLGQKTQLAALQDKANQDIAAGRRAAMTTAFGIDDISGDATSRIAAAVSYRDAQDRVANLKTPSEALQLLQRAEGTGDELLARAVAQRAYDQRLSDPSWGEALDQYLSTRPTAAQAVSDLLAADRSPNARQLFAFVAPPPPEVSGLADHQLAQLASDPSFSGVGA